MTDLNAIAKAILSNQQQHAAGRNTSLVDDVNVDRDGNIFLGPVDAGRPVSQVDPEIMANSARDFQDRQDAQQYLPAQTDVLQLQDGRIGFRFPVHCKLGHAYIFLAYFDGGGYRVATLSPRAEDILSAVSGHASHVLKDGHLCLAPNAGPLPSLRKAFAKSVIWANGASLMRFGGVQVFPFSTASTQ